MSVLVVVRGLRFGCRPSSKLVMSPPSCRSPGRGSIAGSKPAVSLQNGLDRHDFREEGFTDRRDIKIVGRHLVRDGPAVLNEGGADQPRNANLHVRTRLVAKLSGNLVSHHAGLT